MSPLPPSIVERLSSLLSERKELVGTFVAERYRVARLIGRGGMGEVYEVHDQKLNRFVALKAISRRIFSENGLTSFFQEIESAARLDHPHIVAIYDCGLLEDGRPFYTMRLVRGRTLEKSELPNKPREEILSLLRKVASAVQYAHEQGTVHGDLTPRNILLDERGEPQVLDWGLSRAIGEISSPRGTPAFMAPEHAEGSIDRATDVYGLGAVLYWSLTGRPPFVAESLPELLRRVREEDPPCAGIPPNLKSVCLKALSKRRERRYPSAKAFGEALREPPRRSRRFLAATGIAIALLSVLLVSRETPRSRARFHYDKGLARWEVAARSAGRFELAGSAAGEAVDHFLRAVKEDPSFDEAWRLLGTARAFRQELAPAEEDLSTAIELNPQSGLAYYARACVRLRRNLFPPEGGLFLIPTNLRPRLVHADVGIGAREDFERSADLLQDPRYTLLARAFVAISEHRTRQAEKLLHQSEQFDPDNGELHLLRGLAAAQRGNLELCVESLSRARAFYAKDQGIALLAAGAHLATGKPAMALSICSEFPPHDPMVLAFRALACLRLGKTTEELGDDVPDHLAVLEVRSWVQRYRAGSAAARTGLTRALERRPGRAYLHYLLALHALLDGETSESIQQCSRAIEIDDSEYEFFLIRGNGFLSENNFDAALRDYSRALDLGGSEDPRIYLNRADARLELGDTPGALEDLRRARALSEEHPRLHAELLRSVAFLMAWAGRKEEAIQVLGHILRANPHQWFARYDRARMRKGAGALEDLDWILRHPPSEEAVQRTFGPELWTPDFAVKGWLEEMRELYRAAHSLRVRFGFQSMGTRRQP